MDCSMPCFTVLHHLPEIAQTHVHWSVMPFNHLILCHPFFLLPSIFPSIRGFSNESALCIMWSKYWSFSISPSNKYLWLISFRIDWFDILAVQGILKSLIQLHSLKASVLRRSAFFSIQLSYLYTTTGKILALTVQTIVIQVISLFFNMLSRFVIAFLPRSKSLLILCYSHHPQWFWSLRLGITINFFVSYFPYARRSISL